jgi:UDP-GlcNAc:undecaprenyl-phosphate GlcNAc-1-phosphate transferase
MIEPAWATVLAAAMLWLGDSVNRRLFGFLPDDPPRPGRKQHARPIPLAGVLLVPIVAAWLVAEADFTSLVAVGLAGAIGFLDDRDKERGPGLDWRTKGLGLTVASAIAAASIAAPLSDPLPFALLFLFAFVLTNATTFLDNTDGVAGAVAAAMLLLATGGHGAMAAGGFAALGFLPWNWPRPRLFLGDAGAYALGLLAAIAIARRVVAEPAALWFAAVPLADFTQVVGVRLWLGHPPWVGDRRHLTHIAQHLGLRRWLVAPLFAALAAAAALLA